MKELAVDDRDLKSALKVSKPIMAYSDYAGLVYDARQREYGNDKYKQTGNYLRPPPPGCSDVDRALQYLSASLRHTHKVCHSIIRNLGNGRDSEPTLADAVYCRDTDTDETGFPPSGLPHIGGALTSLCMAIQQLVDAGLLPADPGTPWRKEKHG